LDEQIPQKGPNMHCFYVAKNLAPGFVIGYETEPDNFYIVGQTLLSAPVISGRIYGPNGEFLFGLVSNKLTSDSETRFRLAGLGTRPGWSIQDEMGKKVLTIETLEGEEAKHIVQSLGQVLEKEDEMAGRALEEFTADIDRVTRIYGAFFDKHGNLAARGDEGGIEVNCPFMLG